MPVNYRIPDLFAHYTIDENGCWIWLGSKNGCGYGSSRRGGKTIRMHRAFYERHVGPIPAGLLVCHKCDVRACVNPEHLFFGTNKDNMDDRDRKGRLKVAPLGEKHNKAKLTEAQVLEARLLWKGGASGRSLARKFDVNRKTMFFLLKGRNWKNVGGLDV